MAFFLAVTVSRFFVLYQSPNLYEMLETVVASRSVKSSSLGGNSQPRNLLCHGIRLTQDPPDDRLPTYEIWSG